MLVKVCGARTHDDIRLLRGASVDMVGLWHGVPGGHADLTIDAAASLACAAHAGGGPEPVLVTLLDDPCAVADAVRATGVRCVQLHGYLPPGAVRAVRASVGPATTVVKTLHVRDAACVEQGLTAAYERAGADMFLIDRVGAGGRVGSTGSPVPDAVAAGLAASLRRPFLLAGGVSAAGPGPFPATAAQPGLTGVDVDSAARSADLHLDHERVAGIRAAWSAGGS